MASPLLKQRRAHIKGILDCGGEISTTLRKAIAKKFKCSAATVYSDIVALTVDFGGFTRHIASARKARIHARDNSTCQYCGVQNPTNPVVDHVVPYVQGGIAREHNLVSACQKCNSTKCSDVWVPDNLEAITLNHPEWRNKILSLAVPKRVLGEKIAHKPKDAL